MPSILPGFEYDIFISYRQKDNKGDHWVTEFVNALKAELDSTFKEEISIYFDANPHDGLLETHNVDKSLEGKLKCLIFIPIISQTYCDPKSFAWQDEFCAFNKLSQQDQFGRDIKLKSGNVASRILPIKIHEIDTNDKTLLENELGGVLRAIDFIYKESGVNRPLKLNDSKNDNQHKTDYRNQVNKVANAIKELLSSLQNSPKTENQSQGKSPKPAAVLTNNRKKLTVISIVLILLGFSSFLYFYYGGFGDKLSEIDREKRSIAVIPFTNMNNDPDQDYFSNGITEDILNHLVKISDLNVKSRTSTLQYKNTKKTIVQIGEELNVNHVVEGSVRRVGNQIRVVVQLIDAKKDIHLWSETYDRELKDVLALQSEIAIEIAQALESRLTTAEKEKINKEVTTDVSAYDFYLQTRDKVSNSAFVKEEFQEAMDLINKAIALDPSFSNAYAMKANLWYLLSTFGLPQKIWEDSARLNAAKSIAMDSLNSEGYLVRARIDRFLGNLSSSDRDVEIAYRLNPKDLNVQNEYGYQLLREGDERGAEMVIKAIERNYSTKQTEYYQSYLWPLFWAGDFEGAETSMKKVISLNPQADYNYYPLSIALQYQGKYEESIKTSEEALRISPISQGALDNLAWSHFRLQEYEKAAEYWSRYKEVEGSFEDKSQTIPFRHRLAMCYLKLGDTRKARELLLEDKEIQTQMLNKSRSTGTWSNKGGIYYDLAVDMALLGFDDEAIQKLDSAYKYEFRATNLYENDPAFEKIKSLPQFRKVQKKLDDYSDFMKVAFTNAFNKAQASKELKNILK